MSRPKQKIDPRDLMETALQLIKEELEELNDPSAEGKLDSENTAALIRYSDALVKYVKDGIKRQEEEKEQLAKMSNEELGKIAAEMASRGTKT